MRNGASDDNWTREERLDRDAEHEPRPRTRKAFIPHPRIRVPPMPRPNEAA